MNKTNSTAVLGIMITVFVSCTPKINVSSDYDKKADFTKYKSFSLFKSEQISDAISALNEQRIVEAIRNEMVKKGYREEPASPDLLVNATAIVKDKVAINANTNYYGYGGFYRPYYYYGGVGGSSSTTYNVAQYKDGSLIIDVVDAKSKNLLWEGTGNSEIDRPIKDPDAAIPKAVTSILSTFPAAKGK